MYRFRSLKYLATTGVITGLLMFCGYASSFIKIGVGYLQLADIIALPLITFIPGPMILFANPIAMAFADIMGGYFVFVPITIVVRILMFVIIRILEPYFHFIISYFFAVLPVLIIYPPYTYFISNFDHSYAITALINDAVQAISTYIFSLFITWFLIRINSVSYGHLWSDSDFDYLREAALENSNLEQSKEIKNNDNK
ncbi:hypothetical protein [Spiroplasma endosymbiont of Asaphidion curtum]|uniref:hypothetical protein n=1 Tax=Spiroplasma endosymbiont of Asaphidion curtum TaxID=3066281 RepID=UPI00313B7D78